MAMFGREPTHLSDLSGLSPRTRRESFKRRSYTFNSEGTVAKGKIVLFDFSAVFCIIEAAH